MTATERPSPSEARDWEEISSRPEFQVLRHRLRSFVFPMTGLFLGWYLLYVLLASYAPSFMAIKLFGNINVGLVFGLLQFVSTFLITFLYVRFADRKFDPLAEPAARRHREGRPHRRRGRSDDLFSPQGVEGSNPILNLAIFGLFVVVTLAIVIRVSKRATSGASDFYTAGGGFSGPQNGIAISGDYLSAASFLGIAGAIAINGYDGFLYSVGFLVAWLVALLLVAELLRNTGKYTMGDVLAFKMRQRPVRAAAATSTLAVSFFYLLAQMAGAGGLVALLLNITSKTGQGIVIAIVGAVMIAYVLIGGMRGTTWVQIIKAVLLIAGAGIMTVWVLALFGFSLSAVLGAAVDRAGQAGEKLLAPGRTVRQERHHPDRLHLPGPGPGARHRGPAAHPHALLHGAHGQGGPPLGGVGDLPDRPVLPVHAGPRVRRGRAGRPGRDQEGARRRELGGPAAGLRARRHDPARHHRRRRLRDDPRGGGRPDDHRVGVVRPRHLRQRDQARRGRGRSSTLEVKIARRTAVVIGIVAILGGILANGQNIAFLVALAFAVAASANLPTILYSLFWKRFNTTGALCSIYGGLGITLILIIFSPVVSGKPVDPVTGRSTSMIQGVDFHWFPLDNPGLISIPLSFLLGYLGTVLAKGDRPDPAKVAEMEVKSLTGADAAKALVH